MDARVKPAHDTALWRPAIAFSQTPLQPTLRWPVVLMSGPGAGPWSLFPFALQTRAWSAGTAVFHCAENPLDFRCFPAGGRWRLLKFFETQGGDAMLDEFKKFAMRGNVIDLAVGVIIGAAFGAIVTSLVGDIIMPIIGAVTGGLDFTNYYTAMSAKVPAGLSYADAKKQGAVLGWGQFLTISLNFLIIA